MWTKYSKDDECRGKRYTPVFCWVSYNIEAQVDHPMSSWLITESMRVMNKALKIAYLNYILV